MTTMGRAGLGGMQRLATGLANQIETTETGLGEMLEHATRITEQLAVMGSRASVGDELSLRLARAHALALADQIAELMGPNRPAWYRPHHDAE